MDSMDPFAISHCSPRSCSFHESCVRVSSTTPRRCRSPGSRESFPDSDDRTRMTGVWEWSSRVRRHHIGWHPRHRHRPSVTSVSPVPSSGLIDRGVWLHVRSPACPSVRGRPKAGREVPRAGSVLWRGSGVRKAPPERTTVRARRARQARRIVRAHTVEACASWIGSVSTSHHAAHRFRACHGWLHRELMGFHRLSFSGSSPVSRTRITRHPTSMSAAHLFDVLSVPSPSVMPVGTVVFDDRAKVGNGDVWGDRLLGQPDGSLGSRPVEWCNSGPVS